VANTASAKKRIRSTARRSRYNKVVRARSRTAVKVAKAAIENEEAAQARAAALTAISELDKAAGKGVIHPNNAARRKSRLVKQLNALEKAPA
jgi:small subunit ribosomal protein S20